ncbi:MAG: D-alanyl-D-alanine carboxypeptidase, partial [Candidatus Dormibacteraeota bacterium]|nr:D-alanyl-D-alanine carboxypeptidase [Candidatus Dormibacteraeota bacterium]
MPWPRRRVLVVIPIALAVIAAEVVVEVRVLSPLPLPTTTIDLPDDLVAAPGTPQSVQPPSTGSFSLVTDDGESLAASDANTPRPIGSVAKTMTALLVLQAHPLRPGVAGPELAMTADDVALYEQAVAAGGSAVPVRAGELLSERDLLLALLLPSANNIADTLARWVAGSVSAFTARANSEAAALGLRATHFDDASGVSDRTVSTAADLVV